MALLGSMHKSLLNKKYLFQDLSSVQNNSECEAPHLRPFGQGDVALPRFSPPVATAEIKAPTVGLAMGSRAPPGKFFRYFQWLSRITGGETGIRTLGTLARTTVFETAPFDRSGTSPSSIWLDTLGGIVNRFEPAIRAVSVAERGRFSILPPARRQPAARLAGRSQPTGLDRRRHVVRDRRRS